VTETHFCTSQNFSALQIQKITTSSSIVCGLLMTYTTANKHYGY